MWPFQNPTPPAVTDVQSSFTEVAKSYDPFGGEVVVFKQDGGELFYVEHRRKAVKTGMVSSDQAKELMEQFVADTMF